MDKISISGLQVDSLIGVYDWERQRQTRLLVDITVSIPLAKAAETDHVEDTLDYAALASCLESVAADSEFQLLEALAGKMIDTVFNRFGVEKISLVIIKPGILPNAQSVSVQLNRSR